MPEWNHDGKGWRKMPDEMVQAYADQMDASQSRSFRIACVAAVCLKSYFVLA